MYCTNVMLLWSTKFKAFVLANTVIFLLSQLVEAKTEDEVKKAFNVNGDWTLMDCHHPYQ